jgi:hypothetical protein
LLLWLPFYRIYGWGVRDGTHFHGVGDIAYFQRITLPQKAAKIPTLQAHLSVIVLQESYMPLEATL